MMEITNLLTTGDSSCLYYAEQHLPELLRDEGRWQSLDITYEDPQVHRIWTPYLNGRIYFHKIFPCVKPFMHPHRWPSTVKLLYGSYDMDVGYMTAGRIEIICTINLNSNDVYEMLNPLGYHSVSPTNPSHATFSLMVTGTPFENPTPCSPKKLHVPKELHKMEREAMFELARSFYH